MRLLQAVLVLLLHQSCWGRPVSTEWLPADFPNPNVQGALCNRPGIVSFVCDADSLLSKADLDTIEVSRRAFCDTGTAGTRLEQLTLSSLLLQGIIKQPAIPEEPFAGPDCDFLPLGRAGFQVSVFLSLHKCSHHHPTLAQANSAGPQVGVAVMRKMDLQGQLPGQAAEAFATALFDAWGPGDRRCHNGAILLLSVEDRQVRHVPADFGPACRL